MTRRSWALATLAGLGLCIAVVVLLGRGDHGGPSTAGTTTTMPTVVSPGASAPGPSAERAGMPAGFAATDSGALAAASAYATASQRWMYLDDAKVAAAVRAISTDAAADRLTTDVLDEVRTAREGLMGSSGRVWWIVRPLATRVETQWRDAARIDVWVVSVLSASGVAVPQSDWRTVTLELVWERGDWKVDGIHDSAGPTPMVGPRDRPWSPEQLDRALDGFTRVDIGQL